MPEVSQPTVPDIQASACSSGEVLQMGDGVVLAQKSHVALAPSLANQEKKRKPVTKKVIMQRMIAGFRLHKTPRVGDISENDPQTWGFPAARCPRLWSF